MELGESSTSTPLQAKKRQRKNPFERITPDPSFTSPSVMKKMPCDVFINHRGCDTKFTLATDIYNALRVNNINAFLDVELELGDSIPVEIHQAMDTAGLHIAIFSENYAGSAWCLAELCYMLQTGTPVIPVFYHVNPDDLRWVDQGKGCYALAFSQHEEKGRYPSNMLHDWKMALQRVSNLSGHVLKKNSGDERMLLERIVNSTRSRLLEKEPLEVAKHPVGMDEIVRDFERSRQEYVKNEAGVEIVGIVGLGGSGKTTLATELYNRKSSSINRSSFLRDVRDDASKNVLHKKQKKLLDDLRIRFKSFNNVKDGKEIIENRLKSHLVLIVVDDVDHEDQLDALLPPKESLGRGSIVIITTRDESILTKWGITSIYKIRPLQRLHAKQLFSWRAFSQPSPPQAFEDLVEKFLDSCHGLPLSLKVIGGQLCGAKTKCREYWVSLLDKIQRILPNDILKVLKVSYDALDKEEQEIFLDVACFFIGERKSVAIEVWDASGWSGLYSLEALQSKCLVEIYEATSDGGEELRDHIRMHDHLRDLGRQIAKTHPRPRIQIKEFPFRGITSSEDSRIKFEGKRGWGEAIECTEKCAELLRGVLWLEWYGCDTSIPSWLPLDTVVLLEFYNEEECLDTLWEDSRPPLQLRELTAPWLQSLPRSIGRLQHLKRIVMRCSCLSSLPDCFGDLVNLQYLDLCYSQTLERLPEEFCKLKSLEHLDLSSCSALSSLPNRFGDLMNLKHLDLSGCESLKRLPDSFKKLIQLKYLDVDGCVSLESLDNIPNVKAVYFRDRYEDDPSSIKSGQFLLHFSPVYIDRLLPIICQLSGLKELEIDLSQWSGNLPNSFGNMSSLTSLKVTWSWRSHCWKYLPIDISQMSSLRNLTIDKCQSLYEISDLQGLVSLKSLTIDTCPNLYEISNLQGLVSLTNLEVKGCHDLHKIEGLEHLTSLENLVLWECKKAVIHRLRSLPRLERLQTLNLTTGSISDFGDCIQNIEMEKWPGEVTICAYDLSNKTTLREIELSDFVPILDAFRSRDVHVHPITEWSSIRHERNLSNAAVVCYLLQSDNPWGAPSVRVGKQESSWVQVNLFGRCIVMSVFKEVSCTVEDGVSGLLSLDVLDRDDYVDVLGGCLIIGERGCILDGFKQLFQTISNESPTSSDEFDVLDYLKSPASSDE